MLSCPLYWHNACEITVRVLYFYLHYLAKRRGFDLIWRMLLAAADVACMITEMQPRWETRNLCNTDARGERRSTNQPYITSRPCARKIVVMCALQKILTHTVVLHFSVSLLFAILLRLRFLARSVTISDGFIDACIL